MNWKAHFILGLVISVLLFILIGYTDNVWLVFIGAVGGFSALVPDLDLSNSKGKKLLDILFILFVLILSYITNCGLYLCAPNFEMIMTFLIIIGAYHIVFFILSLKHRGITHTIFGSTVFALIIFFFAGLEIATATFFGYLSHLIADGKIKLF